MSYILEGLKKLEQKRRQEERAPGLLTFEEEKTLRSERPKLWPFLIFLALLLNVGIIIWWIGPWHLLERPARPHPTIPGPTTKAATSISLEKMKKHPPVLRGELPPPKIINELPKSPAVEKTKKIPAPVAEKTPPPKKSPESQLSIISKVVPEGRTVKLSDLPAEIKKSLPALKMSVHYYSPDKQARFATINDRTLHEGEALSEGLRVVEINPDGTVLFYRGYRFLISVNENL